MAISDVNFNQTWWQPARFAYFTQTLSGFAPPVTAVRPAEQSGMRQVGGVPPSQLPQPLRLDGKFSFGGPATISGSTMDFMV
ncbi:MAG: hypothetical protein HZA50_10630 [Planctomycetes bacterium]|nr:hypothetical protein [Planctomycetota bacterium]